MTFAGGGVVFGQLYVVVVHLLLFGGAWHGRREVFLFGDQSGGGVGGGSGQDEGLL